MNIVTSIEKSEGVTQRAFGGQSHKSTVDKPRRLNCCGRSELKCERRVILSDCLCRIRMR